MNKQLSELLEASKPNNDFGSDGKGIVMKVEDIDIYKSEGWGAFRAVDRESYDRMKRVAIELAKACEKINIHCQAITISSWRETRLKFTNINNEAISKARAMLKGENNE